jgi:hypothetical protein
MKKIYKTKKRLIYKEPTFVGKLRTQFTEREKTQKEPINQIFMTENELNNYMKELPSFQSIFYQGKNVITKKRPMFRGIEIFTYK